MVVFLLFIEEELCFSVCFVDFSIRWKNLGYLPLVFRLPVVHVLVMPVRA